MRWPPVTTHATDHRMKWTCLPGMDGTGTLFEPLLHNISGQALAYPNLPLGYTELEAYVRERLPAEPFGLLAESFSGPIGVRIAADPPPQLSALALVATFFTPPVPLPRGIGVFIRPAFTVTPPRWAIRALLTGRSAPASLARDVQEALRNVSARTMSARVAALRTVDVRSHASRISVPSVYVQALRDRLVRPPVQPPMPVRTIDGPHLLCQTHPAEVAAVLREFA